MAEKLYEKEMKNSGESAIQYDYDIRKSGHRVTGVQMALVRQLLSRFGGL